MYLSNDEIIAGGRPILMATNKNVKQEAVRLSPLSAPYAKLFPDSQYIVFERRSEPSKEYGNGFSVKDVRNSTIYCQVSNVKSAQDIPSDCTAVAVHPECSKLNKEEFPNTDRTLHSQRDTMHLKMSLILLPS